MVAEIIKLALSLVLEGCTYKVQLADESDDSENTGPSNTFLHIHNTKYRWHALKASIRNNILRSPFDSFKLAVPALLYLVV